MLRFPQEDFEFIEITIVCQANSLQPPSFPCETAGKGWKRAAVSGESRPTCWEGWVPRRSALGSSAALPLGKAGCMIMNPPRRSCESLARAMHLNQDERF